MPQDGEIPQAGTLQLELAETISVDELQGVLTLIGRLYFDALWLGLAEEAPDGPFPDFYSPTQDEELWVNRLEIGTPNVLELLGQADALMHVATFLGTLVGGPIALNKAAKAAESIARARKLWIEGTFKRKAIELRSKGKISETALKHKQEPPANLDELAVAATSTVKPQPVQVTPAPKRNEDRAIREELKTIGRPDALKAFRAYWNVHRKIQSETNARVLPALRSAYDSLAKALAPLTDQQVHELIERITARAVAIRLMQ